MSDIEFSQYTTDYIAGVMSLREPQKESLKRLERIVENIPLDKKYGFGKITGMYQGNVSDMLCF